jgi:hypothetical protein
VENLREDCATCCMHNHAYELVLSLLIYSGLQDPGA